MADPLTLGASAVLFAVTSVSSGALSGAGESLRQNAAERLGALLRRMRRRSDGEPDATPVEVPTTDAERRALQQELLAGCAHHPADAAELGALVRELDLIRQTAPHTAASYLAAPGAGTPQLPRADRHFTNHDETVARVRRLLDEADPAYGPPPIVLIGPGGIGKSALAVHLAHDLAPRFPHAVLHEDLNGTTARQARDPAAVRRRFLRQLGLPDVVVPADPESQADLYRLATGEWPRLIVLDNALNHAQLRPLLPAGGSSLLLVTTRHRQLAADLAAEEGAVVLPVGPLSGDDARLLLTRRFGDDFLARHREHVDTFVRWGRGIPSRLSTVVGQLATGGDPAAVARELSASDSGADTPDRAPDAGHGEHAGPPARGPEHGTTDEHGAELAYRNLSEPAARIYRALGMFRWPGLPVPAAAAALCATGPQASGWLAELTGGPGLLAPEVVAALDTAEPEARRALAELTAVRLVEAIPDGRYRLPETARPHAERRALAEDGPSGRTAVARGLTGWFLRFAQEADFRVMPRRWRIAPYYAELREGCGDALPDAAAGRRALEELAAERENLAEAVRVAEECRLDGVAWQLCEAMWSIHLYLGFNEQAITTHQLGVAAARRERNALGDPRALARVLTQLSFPHSRLGQYRQAVEVLTEAAAIDREAGHLRGEASAVEALGLVRLAQWRSAEAEECFLRAERLWDGVGPDDAGAEDAPRARALLMLHRGRALRPQERYAEAAELLTDALARFGALPNGPDAFNQAKVRVRIGETHLAARDWPAARAALTVAHRELGDVGAVDQQGYAAELLGTCAEESAELDEAAGWFRDAADRYASVADHASAVRVEERRRRVTGGAG